VECWLLDFLQNRLAVTDAVKDGHIAMKVPSWQHWSHHTLLYFGGGPVVPTTPHHTHEHRSSRRAVSLLHGTTHVHMIS